METHKHVFSECKSQTKIITMTTILRKRRNGMNGGCVDEQQNEKKEKNENTHYCIVLNKLSLAHTAHML